MKKTFFLLAIFAVATLSCIRQEFDLNQDLDTKIRFGGDVMHIPIGTTDSLFLGDFLNVDSIDILDVFNDDGYAIIVENTLNVAVSEIEDFYFAIEPLSNAVVESDTGFYLPQPAIDAIISILPDFSGSITLEQLNTEATTSGSPLYIALGDEFYRNQFPLPSFASLDTVIYFSMTEILDNENIASVDTLWLEANAGFNVFVQPQNLPSGTMEAQLDTLRLEFPPSIHLDMNNEFVVSRHVFMKRFAEIPRAGLTIQVPVLFMTDLYENGTVILDDIVNLYARYSLTGAYDGGFFPTENYSTRLDLSVTSNLNFESATVTASFGNDLAVDLSILPDLLLNNREGLVLDVNPHLSLRINSNLDVSKTTLVLEPFLNGHATNSVRIPIDLTPGVDNFLWIADVDNPALRPSTHTFQRGGLQTLIRTIPDSIVVRLESQALFGFNVETYAADLDYEFVVPLTLGDDFSIIIQDTFHLDARIGEMISGNSIGLSVRALNGIPLNLTAIVTPIDENNTPLPGITIRPFEIVAGMTMDDDPETLMLNDQNNDQLQYMRGLVFQFVVSPGANATLRPENFIQIRLNARIEGGVTVDLNNL